ncbi:coiled-coil domain-containing protein 112-like [Venturia canescens]|uniref:coiled-coil domain-containing protein 112-like n=1 Tax=Venturia canescens TaxID=32260 RepID=UPI001C9C2B58|nr:coiled-coil domain-containing protein 112-like [Venturia canescens]
MRSSAQKEYIKSSMKLKRQEEMIEKMLEHCLENMKLDPGIMRVLKDERCFRALERKKWATPVQTLARDTEKSLDDIKMSMRDMQEDRKIDIESFRDKLMSLASKFREFEKDTTMEALANEEMELDREISLLPLDSMKKENRTSCRRKKSRENNVTDFQDYRGAKDFDALIAKTGHTQYWSEPDHLFFLKVRKNCENMTSLVSAIRARCPDLTAERIINHEAWYKVYLDLREKQRNAIREWRENREAKKQGNRAKGDSETESCEDGEKNVRARESLVNRRNSNATMPKNKTRLGGKNEASMAKKELVKRWKAEKKKAMSLESEQSRSEMESLGTRKENRRLARAAAIKTTVVAYKASKMENTTSSSTASVAESERVASKTKLLKMLKSYRSQDEEFLRRRKAMLEKKKMRPSTVVANSRVDSRPIAVVSTLLNPTKVWLEKCKKAPKDPNEAVLSRGFCYVKDISKLGTYRGTW